MTLLKAQSSLTLVRGLGYKVIRWAERRARRNKVGAWSMLDPCKACIIITMEADHSWYNGLERSPEDTADRSTVPGQDSRLQLQLKNRYLQCRPDWQIDSSKCLCNWEDCEVGCEEVKDNCQFVYVWWEKNAKHINRGHITERCVVLPHKSGAKHLILCRAMPSKL